MADIDIVPKQRSYTWLWIVLALVVIAALWWAFAGGNELGSPRSALQPAVDHVAGLTGGVNMSRAA